MAEIYLVQGDLKPSILATLKYDDGSAVDLSDAQTVKFHMKSKDGTIKIQNRACTIISVTEGKVRMDWQSGDTDTPGTYYGEFEVVWNDGSTQTFPSKEQEPLKIVIRGQIA